MARNPPEVDFAPASSEAGVNVERKTQLLRIVLNCSNHTVRGGRTNTSYWPSQLLIIITGPLLDARRKIPDRLDDVRSREASHLHQDLTRG